METLNSSGDLLRWLGLAHLISREEQQTLADSLQSQNRQFSLLGQIRELRALWKINLERLVTGKALCSDMIDFINRALSRDLSRQVLVQKAGTRAFQVHREHAPQDPGGRVLALIAEAMAQFLATANLQYLRRCSGAGCVIYFYDTTKSHRRQWCSMAVCGNRHKVARFRAKHS